ncbi:MAG: aminopeptidase N [Pseudomonadota bacterium]
MRALRSAQYTSQTTLSVLETLAMLDAQSIPQPIYLADYTAPAFAAERIALRFMLDPAQTEVISTVEYVRQGAAGAPLLLNGSHQSLKWVKLDGAELPPDAYVLTDETLTIANVPDTFTLEVCSTNCPQDNTALTGLYVSGGNFCTQCEAEGFRRITYFLDRPDIMARYAVYIEADKKAYPVLLSNGNPIGSGDLDGGRHWAEWEDPFPKPAYLFALVAGDLHAVTDRFVTQSGREVTLNIYVRKDDLDKCDHAMLALKNSMRWDEEVFGLEYDLDLYNIVAVSDFNMGAMENKGLNVFNTRYVLANEATATDLDFDLVEGVIAHEYFHNWTGNRVTCRDWFQLSLKEGLTVYRDQEFSADMGSRGLKRIDDVRGLRGGQFPEDAGPMAHPVRPESYVEINNFYTATVYNKGAEVVRMYETLLGKAGFRKGMDLYFQRHDGQAVTCDDFRRAMADANDADLEQFKLWYSQAGTPTLTARWDYDAPAQSLTLTLKQNTPDTPNQTGKQPMVMPVVTALIGNNGEPLSFSYAGKTAEEHTLVLTEAEQSFTLRNVSHQPVPSLLRGFSAPVKLETALSEKDKAYLAAHDSDPFNRWEAMQSLAADIILARAGAQSPTGAGTSAEALITVMENALGNADIDLDFKAEMCLLPTDTVLMEQIVKPDPQAIIKAREDIRTEIAERLRDKWDTAYHSASSAASGMDRAARAARRLKNVALGYRMASAPPDVVAEAFLQFTDAGNMTDKLAALGQLVHTNTQERIDALGLFYSAWKHDALVLDKWFSLQAQALRADVLECVTTLLDHPDFNRKNPNRFRALIAGFAFGNPKGFHRKDGEGYRLLADQIIDIDASNPQLAARMIAPLGKWRRIAQPYSDAMKTHLRRIAEHQGLSKDSFEIAAKSLA